MAVSGADQAKLVRIHAEALFELEATLVGLARVLARQHVPGLWLGPKTAFVPGAVVSKLIVWRQPGMGLAIALFHRYVTS